MTFAEEKVKDVWDELVRLFRAHWDETEMYRHGMGFNPDRRLYEHYNDIGYYHLYTARDAGRLVGNIGMYVTKSNMHTQTSSAREDTLFFLPEYRRSGNASALLEFMEDKMRAMGVRELNATTKLTNAANQMLTKLGFTHVANEYRKEL